MYNQNEILRLNVLSSLLTQDVIWTLKRRCVLTGVFLLVLITFGYLRPYHIKNQVNKISNNKVTSIMR